jgi:hypothetical protein
MLGVDRLHLQTTFLFWRMRVLRVDERAVCRRRLADRGLRERRRDEGWQK